jgi:hypothetical protein
MAIFAKKLKTPVVTTTTDKMVALLTDSFNGFASAGTSATAKVAMSMESLRDDQLDTLRVATEELSTSIEAMASKLGITNMLSTAQKDAAMYAAILAGDVQGYMSAPISRELSVAGENMSVVNLATVEDGFYDRAFSMEAYDNRQDRKAQMYSLAYNMQAARQDEFGETFYPTIVVAPDNVGFGVTVRLTEVYNGITRNVNGAMNDFNRINIIRAIANHDILRNEMTNLFPVYRATGANQNTNMFVNATLVQPYSVVVAGETIVTAPISFGVVYDLLGISQTDSLLANGVEDETDSIDPRISLENVYLSVTGTDSTGAAVTDIIKLPTMHIPTNNFTYSPQHNFRKMQLSFYTNAILLTANTTQADGSPLVALAGIAANNLLVRLNMTITGSCNIETGETALYANNVSIYSIQNASGTNLGTTTAPGQAIATAVNSANFLGYTLTAWRTNMNRRTRGQILNITYYTQLYNIPLRSPITALHPVTVDLVNDTTSLNALITATHIRTSNYAVTNLLEAQALLSEYANVNAIGPNSEGPELLGVGRYLVLPYYEEGVIDFSVDINSIRSADRIADIQATLVNRIRDVAYRMYRDSQYIAAAAAMAGGMAPPPTVIIGTDPVIARYLMVTGDMRTLGNGFDVRIVSTLDSRMAGKIFVTFGQFSADVNAAPNPLHFGCMAWKPELTITLPISRGGQVSKELTVQPSFLHIVNCPVLAMFNVVNIPDALNSVGVPMLSGNTTTSGIVVNSGGIGDLPTSGPVI